MSNSGSVYCILDKNRQHILFLGNKVGNDK